MTSGVFAGITTGSANVTARGKVASDMIGQGGNIYVAELSISIAGVAGTESRSGDDVNYGGSAGIGGLTTDPFDPSLPSLRPKLCVGFNTITWTIRSAGG